MKERLTGAIILVVLIVLLVPELLSGPKGPSASAPAGVAPTSSEEPPLRSYTINLGDDSHARTGATGSSGPAMPQPSGPDQAATQPNSAQTSAPPSGVTQSNGGVQAQTQAQAQAAGSGQAGNTPQPSTTPQPSGTPQPSSTPQPNSAPRPSYAQQGGTPRAATPGQATAAQTHGATSAANANAPTTKGSDTKGSDAAAPSRATTSHQSAAAPSQSAPRVAKVSQKPAKPHSVAAANTLTNSEPAWGVQLGVFASRENAERLALEVRVKGFKASVSPVTAGHRKLYRVRVGPAPDRSAAQELQGRLKASGRAGGTVVPYS